MIAFSLEDSRQAGRDLDPRHQSLMVILNATPNPISLPGYRLHPVLRNSSDARNREAAVVAGQFQVPALTVAVFVQPQAR